MSSLSASVLVTWRCLLATLGAMLWVKCMSDRKLWLGKVVVAKLMGIGVLIGLHWLCLFGAVKIANVSIALAGLATLSLFTAFAEPLLNRGRIRTYEVMLGLLVLAGIVLIAGTQSAYFAGLGLALVSAFLAAIFMVVNKHMVVSGSDPMVMVYWEMMAAAAVCSLAIPVFDPGGYGAMAFSDPTEWLWLLILALVCTVFAQDFTNRLLRQISAYKLNLAANFEPVYGIMAAALIFGEHEELRLSFYLGALTIVLANFLQPRLQRRFG
ncbi:EamA family transporter [Verrucomicrobiaceae bacterium R5-34]|uniref:EamA family transporter n=1 Tax=Oceaniferula flava TaxID=2800421 RepID=A0AAE2SE38_9BACT|nr:EamA family transporter [Oceaniferula flavus]MBK1829933.1 EamA family transporter [Verrucomicrobiaceae bacterium R5-34]MBK1855219.1 EamA family transporter [Oceaniferula flavus]MBM1136525.1 EamA family transporter [Oceaniferula flavus]